MQHLNDDMDELYKKAGEEYPLFTGSADWQYVNRKLSFYEDDGAKKNTARHLRQWATAAFFLFIPLSFALTRFSVDNKKESKPALPIVSNDKNKVEVAGLVAGSAIKMNHPLKQTENEMVIAANELPVSLIALATPNENLIMKAPQFLPAMQNKNNTFFNLNMLAPFEPNADIFSKSGQALPGNIDAVDKEEKPLIESLKEESEVANTDDGEKGLIKPVLKKQPARFYGGAVVAPEIASVKYQSVKKIGFNMGLVFGYCINKRVQAELGIVLGHKYYYSDGKYTAANSLRKDDAEIKSVDVFNSITEIPVTVRYNIKTTGTSRFFVSAGTVSYIIHKEHYSYDFTKNGVDKEGFKKYDKASDNLFSNVQISAGYSLKLGNIGNMRIEPYYRIPLNGIGISNLPVASAGINIGIIKYFK